MNREKYFMSDISAMASSALAMSQSSVQQQIEMSILKKSAQADQEVADIIMGNAKRIQELSQKASGGINLYI